MRKILVDWLVDVHRKFKLRHETLFLAVNVLDRFLALTSDSVPKGKFQLFGVSCLFIAAKYEEIYPPALSDFVYVCADTYKAEQILEMEGLILNQLGFSLVYSSSLQLLGIYSCESSPGSRRTARRPRPAPGAVPALPVPGELQSRRRAGPPEAGSGGVFEPEDPAEGCGGGGAGA